MPHNNPYVGPRPFERDDAERFFGRERDARDLASLVVAHRVVLLYSASGAGKSSLVNAGVYPALERKAFDLPPPVRVGAPGAAESENPFTATIAEQLGARGSIAEALQARPRSRDEDGEPVPRALVLDQFEELFTAHAEHWQHRAGLFGGLDEALEADERLRVLLVMREEYLAQLEPHAARVRGGLRTRLRLERLDRGAALEAVTRPLEGTGRWFAPGVAEALVDDLLKLRVETGAGETIEVPGEFVEPVHLQVVCSRLWEQLPPGVTEIRAEHASALADLDTVLARFYEDAVAAGRDRTRVPERTLRTWVQEELITSGGTRSTVYRGAHVTAKLPNAAVEALEEHRLVRAEQRSGALWYELTHDRLLGPIQRSNAAFAANEARKRRRRFVTAFVAAIGLAGAVLGAALTLELIPAVKPASPVCAACTGAFGPVALRTGVTYGEYVRMNNQSEAGVPRATLAREGVLATFRVRLRGKGRSFPLISQVVDANTGNIVSEDDSIVLRPPSESVESSWSVWVPAPAEEGSFRMTLRLFRPGSPTGAQPLDTTTTSTFAGTSASRPGVVVTFRIIKTGSGSGRVSGPGLDCGSLCSGQFEFGSEVRLVAKGDADSVFAGWSGACKSANPCVLLAGPVTSIEARFRRR